MCKKNILLLVLSVKTLTSVKSIGCHVEQYTKWLISQESVRQCSNTLHRLCDLWFLMKIYARLCGNSWVKWAGRRAVDWWRDATDWSFSPHITFRLKTNFLLLMWQKWHELVLALTYVHPVGYVTSWFWSERWWPERKGEAACLHLPLFTLLTQFAWDSEKTSGGNAPKMDLLHRDELTRQPQFGGLKLATILFVKETAEIKDFWAVWWRLLNSSSSP